MNQNCMIDGISKELLTCVKFTHIVKMPAYFSLDAKLLIREIEEIVSEMNKHDKASLHFQNQTFFFPSQSHPICSQIFYLTESNLNSKMAKTGAFVTTNHNFSPRFREKEDIFSEERILKKKKIFFICNTGLHRVPAIAQIRRRTHFTSSSPNSRFSEESFLSRGATSSTTSSSSTGWTA